jgi:hypothetical protein
MKSLVLAAALGLAAPLALSGAAQAQVAAGSVPNGFDAPAAAARPAPAAVPPVTAPTNPQAEETLRTVIANAQAGTIDYSLLDEALIARMREQEPRILPLIRSFGAVQAVDFVGSQNGADLFAVTFANAATHWVIGFDDAGKVDALLFRPAQ